MVKGFKLLLDSSQSSFAPGCTVQGKLVASVDKPKKYHSIVVIFWGGVNVYWTESEGTTSSRYRNSETYSHVQEEVWSAENSPTGDLPIGEHTFPFSFQLPQDVPPSFVGKHGHVKYEIEAKIFKTASTLHYKRAAIKSLHVPDLTPGAGVFA